MSKSRNNKVDSCKCGKVKVVKMNKRYWYEVEVVVVKVAVVSLVVAEVKKL